ncbi:uncharacterized protein LACBIDRAFT_310848 [Laccaria bicolor S238N-H82]|uniref:Predicted protein n=1 Tax=Laccaria bicolor (strain S238N-H82 / ATCC MYA-4686) TaxID=486041 RepID=B0DV82_LACBS|nr:uncharacterized protein LACBIDRAFT_310848 [Laccaria bicolor S238N-H82]EDR01466.1 predicted protein [Laccaria bicolor S238N-H82]|eukprot:XP_001887818.1 predicted protein [Laccaria bicolor S238N-H82]
MLAWLPSRPINNVSGGRLTLLCVGTLSSISHSRSLLDTLFSTIHWLSVTLTVLATSLLIASDAGPQCIAFDIYWNLFAFGFRGRDYNAGRQESWGTSGSAKDITTNGRPWVSVRLIKCARSDFEGQYTNAIYVINGDSKNPFTIYIYDATAKSWSAQNTTTKRVSGGNPQFDPTNMPIPTRSFFALDMALLKSASPKAIPWIDVQTPDFNSGQSMDSYQIVMALAQNHIHILGVPGISAGEAKIFVMCDCTLPYYLFSFSFFVVKHL